MKVLGITGGVGAGKSTILDYLNRRYHARIIEADKVGHFLMEPGQKVYYHIVETFGSGILRGDQSIDRQKLGKLVFDDQEKLVKLNCLVHPAVKEYIASEIEKERKEGQVPFVAVEAALLIEDITIRSVMSSGIYMWRLQCAETVFTIPGDMIIRRLMRLLQHSCQRRCS